MDNQQRNLKEQIIEDYISGQSANSISKKYNKNISSIMYLLRKNNIKIRSIGDNVIKSLNKKKLNLSKEFEEIIVGLLMGDGSLRISKKGRNPSYHHTDKNLEAIKHFKQIFENEKITTSEIWVNSQTGCYYFQTECREEFLKYYNIFYNDSSKKILPNILLTPLTLKYWYVGDGSIKKQNGTINNACQISNKWGNEYILSQIKELFTEKSNYYSENKRKCGSFYIPHLGFIKMLDYIGDCPIDCYKYKWELRDVQRL